MPERVRQGQGEQVQRHAAAPKTAVPEPALLRIQRMAGNQAAIASLGGSPQQAEVINRRRNFKPKKMDEDELDEDEDDELSLDDDLDEESDESDSEDG